MMYLGRSLHAKFFMKFGKQSRKVDLPFRDGCLPFTRKGKSMSMFTYLQKLSPEGFYLIPVPSVIAEIIISGSGYIPLVEQVTLAE